ncbi:MAG: hypothetical protein JWN90_346 [Parcubacteria group bacterium]|nr:hypothetical protein [Parcubacteria group bacterium]
MGICASIAFSTSHLKVGSKYGILLTIARLAQLVERVIDVDDVVGSNPASRTKQCPKSQQGQTLAAFLVRSITLASRSLAICSRIQPGGFTDAFVQSAAHGSNRSFRECLACFGTTDGDTAGFHSSSGPIVGSIAHVDTHADETTEARQGDRFAWRLRDCASRSTPRVRGTPLLQLGR